MDDLSDYHSSKKSNPVLGISAGLSARGVSSPISAFDFSSLILEILSIEEGRLEILVSGFRVGGRGGPDLFTGVADTEELGGGGFAADGWELGGGGGGAEGRLQDTARTTE